MPTRQIAWNVGEIAVAAMYVLVVVQALFLAYGATRRYQMWRRGKPFVPVGQVGERLRSALAVAFLHKRLIRPGYVYAGLMHLFIFWGFVVLFTTIVEAFGAVYQEGFHIPLIGQWGPLGALQDFFVVAVLVSIGAAFWIRKIQRPGRFRGSHLKEADYILVAISGIMISGSTDSPVSCITETAASKIATTCIS